MRSAMQCVEPEITEQESRAEQEGEDFVAAAAEWNATKLSVLADCLRDYREEFAAAWPNRANPHCKNSRGVDRRDSLRSIVRDIRACQKEMDNLLASQA